ncbi:MAG: hypothetical protein K940chlam2_00982 [Chlamydiae bacterium]|nr:hypothetical protein [Chlamydiota bacterium]
MTHVATAKIHIDASLEAVWKALIDPVAVKAYFFGTDLDTDWSVGSPIFFRGEYEGKSYEDKGVVLSFDPSKELSYSYFSSMSGLAEKPENYHTIRYALAEEKGATLLTVTQENLDSEERATHSAASWQQVLKGLEKFVTVHQEFS